MRIATISKAMLTIKLNSSYVLIIITTFRKVLGLSESTSPGCPVKYIILFGIPRVEPGTYNVPEVEEKS